MSAISFVVFRTIGDTILRNLHFQIFRRLSRLLGGKSRLKCVQTFEKKKKKLSQKCKETKIKVGSLPFNPSCKLKNSEEFICFFLNFRQTVYSFDIFSVYVFLSISFFYFSRFVSLSVFPSVPLSVSLSATLSFSMFKSFFLPCTLTDSSSPGIFLNCKNFFLSFVSHSSCHFFVSQV